MAKRIDDIELLRAIAILAVVIEHAERNLITWHSRSFELFLSYARGWSGVDLFFAISGFVIAKDLLPRLQGTTNSRDYLNVTVAFWIRRAWRLLPSAWLWLAIILAATVFFNSSGIFRSFEATAGGTIAAILQFANIHFAKCFAHYDCGANFYYWSLSLEEQFYVLLPLIIFVSRRWLPYVIAILILSQLIVPWRPLLMVNLRTDGLLLGVLLALWTGTDYHRRLEPRFLSRSWLSRLAALLALLFVLGYTTAAQDSWKLASYRFSIIAVVSILLVWLASYDKDYLFTAKWLKLPMLWIGSRSYGIYLIHPFVYAAILEFWYHRSHQKKWVYVAFDASYSIPFIASAIAAILLLSEMNYRLIEVPLRRKGQQISARILRNTSQ